MSKLEYRMKWYGETEEQAKESLSIIDDEKEAQLQLVQLTAIANQNAQNGNTKDNGSDTTEAQASQNKKQRANESNETTKK
jgi:hypothetical protein